MSLRIVRQNFLPLFALFPMYIKNGNKLIFNGNYKIKICKMSGIVK